MEINRILIFEKLKSELNDRIIKLEKTNDEVTTIIQNTQIIYNLVNEMHNLTKNKILQLIQKQVESKEKLIYPINSRNHKDKEVTKSQTIVKRKVSNLTNAKSTKTINTKFTKSMPKLNTLHKSSKSEVKTKPLLTKTLKENNDIKKEISKKSTKNINSLVTNIKTEKIITKTKDKKIIKPIKNGRGDDHNDIIIKNKENEVEEKTKIVSAHEMNKEEIINDYKEKMKDVCNKKYYEILLKNLDHILKYQTMNESIKYFYFNKQFFKKILYFHINKVEIIIEKFTKKIEEIKSKNKNGFEKDKEPETFKFSKGTEKVAEMINSNQYSKMFLDNSTPMSEILFPYRFLLQVINPLEISPIYEKNDSFIWNYFCQLVNKDCQENKFGTFLLNIIREKYDSSIVNLINLIELYEKNSEKLQPNYFSKRCGTTGFMIFFIKDIIDYFGISIDVKKTNTGRALKTYEDIINYYIDLKEKSIKKMKIVNENK